jgi:16S rRNA (cytosine1402-N4)-methyltransferase
MLPLPDADSSNRIAGSRDPSPVTLAHVSVLGPEAVEAMVTRPNGTYVDATFGRGGHSRRILERLDADGRLLAIDRDPAARALALTWTDPRLRFFHGEFSRLDEALAQCGWAQVDGVLIDLGVSSPQLDDAQRGFSFRFDGPLDMRMNTESGVTAAQWLSNATPDEIKRVLREYGDERFAGSIAKAITASRDAGRPVQRTAELARLVAGAVPGRSRRDPSQHPATRTFQAIRIHVNRELEEIEMILPKAARALRAGGRLAVISFHSLEDRLVKRFIQAHAKPDAGAARLPLRADQLPPARLETLGRIDPSARECADNPRARSAHLRIAQRTAAVWDDCVS